MIIIETSMHQKLAPLPTETDIDAQQTAEWMEAFDQILDEAGPDQAASLLERLLERAQFFGVELRTS